MVSGFGVDLFGQHQFGHADVGLDLLINNVPDIYKELDLENNNLLRRFLLALRDELNVNVIPFITKFPLLRDPRFVRLDLLDFLAADFGIKTDEEEVEQFRRSEVLNLYQWLIRKGEDKGYKIKGGIRGYTIEVVALDRINCGLNTSLVDRDEERFVRLFDDIPADKVPLDNILVDDLDAWPNKTLMIRLQNGIFELCRTNILKLRILYNMTPNHNAKSLLKFINSAVNDVKPIHVRLVFEVFIDFGTLIWDITLPIFDIVVESVLGDADWSYYYDAHNFSERVDFAIHVDLFEIQIV